MALSYTQKKGQCCDIVERASRSICCVFSNSTRILSFHHEERNNPGMEALTCNPITSKAEAQSFGIRRQPEIEIQFKAILGYTAIPSLKITNAKIQFYKKYLPSTKTEVNMVNIIIQYATYTYHTLYRTINIEITFTFSCIS